METAESAWITRANKTVHQPGQTTGHYESFFLRANHPSLPLAFWIRYTIFSPQGQPEKAIGELWAVYFDGELLAVTVYRKGAAAVVALVAKLLG